MKLSNFLKTTSQTFFIVLTLAASQAWAATPLSGPAGLALDSRGNLYVANTTSNQILVYSPTYVQLTRKTITAGVSGPSGLAFDSRGNLYVSNFNSWSVTVYDATGKQKPGSTITYGVQQPTRIAIDSLDDVWVDNVAASISMYSTSGTLIGYTVPNIAPEGIATQGAWYVMGTFGYWTQYPAGEYLTKGEAAARPVTYNSASTVISVTFDKKGNYWVRQLSGEVDVVNPNVNLATSVIPPGVTPTSSGMAVDSTRNRIYLAGHSATNSIDVFTTSGVYLYTIN